ncbi:MAG: 4-hydroxyphenylpyruvate dioxygenase [Gammaproteobacteria bacterium]|nr:4-hydroxyphenylpyruvate dioxygenase [Gammaproteobacteria bacterium]
MLSKEFTTVKPKKAATLFNDNPMRTDGFEFLEYASPDADKLAKDFENLGFKPVAKHKSKNVILYRQGHINFILNKEKGFAEDFAAQHGAGVCAMGFRVLDADYAYHRAIKLGATPYESKYKPNSGELKIPGIYGIGGSVIYFIDQYGDKNIYQNDFQALDNTNFDNHGDGLLFIDHVTHNVNRGQMDIWAKFYEKLFNFKEIRYFDIEGKLTGLLSRAMTSPCGKIRIPINEGTDDKSQIEEYLREFKGEGIQHIALGTDDIYSSVTGLKNNKIEFLDVPETYYDLLDERVKNHNERKADLKRLRILVDGAPTKGQGILLQIFTKNMLGPVFFEIIQRKGNEGFGEGNFQALFESIELDQIQRGVI